jgi:hypothetical protein
MEQENSKTDEKNSEKPKVMLRVFIIPILLLMLLTGITVIGIHLVPQDDSGETSQLTGLTTLILIIAVILLFIGTWTIYFSTRYIQFPVWRWIASGVKGEPKLPFPRLPWATKSAMAKAKGKMNKKQRACMWLGNVCMLVGIIPITIGVVWFIVLDITGEHTVGSTSLILFWIGIFMFFTGVCIVRISMPKCTQNMALLQNKQDE